MWVLIKYSVSIRKKKLNFLRYPNKTYSVIPNPSFYVIENKNIIFIIIFLWMYQQYKEEVKRKKMKQIILSNT
jgi:hypothetical protein